MRQMKKTEKVIPPPQKVKRRRLAERIANSDAGLTEKEKEKRKRILSRQQYLSRHKDKVLFETTAELKELEDAQRRKSSSFSRADKERIDELRKKLQLLQEYNRHQQQLDVQSERYVLPSDLDTKQTRDLALKLHERGIRPSQQRKGNILDRGTYFEDEQIKRVLKQSERDGSGIKEDGKMMYGVSAEDQLRLAMTSIDFISERQADLIIRAETIFKDLASEWKRAHHTGMTEADRDALREKAKEMAQKEFKAEETSMLVDNEESESDEGPSLLTEFERIQKERENLPVSKASADFIKLLETNQVLVIVGHTGSGKTTQIPQYLYDWSVKRGQKNLIVGCTQPRRVAATSVAARVAKERGVTLGHQVGYTIRFDDKTTKEGMNATRIKYMTDGMLLREFLNDPELSAYSAIMLDEAHERTLDTDILFGLLKMLCAKRHDDFKLIVASATLNAEKFSKFFEGAPVFTVQGTLFNVNVYHATKPELDFVEAAVTTALKIHLQKPKGDILIFLPGQEEIDDAAHMLEDRAKKVGKNEMQLIINPIYAAMAQEDQNKIFEPTPHNARKVVIATNIAETSLTINGIVYVVDCGFHKTKTFNPTTKVESLVTVPISQANAIQRMGRAGRVQEGECYRLYTRNAYNNDLLPDIIPEIQRSDVTPIVLLLKSLGIHDLFQFEFLDPPPVECFLSAFDQLYSLNAISDSGDMTTIGLTMSRFPLDVRLSKALIAAANVYDVLGPVIDIAAMLSVDGSMITRRFNQFQGPKEGEDKKNANSFDTDAMRQLGDMGDGTGDHMCLYKIYREWIHQKTIQQQSSYWAQSLSLDTRYLRRGEEIRDQIERLCDDVGMDINRDMDWDDTELSERIRKSLLAGYFGNVAHASLAIASKEEKKKPQGKRNKPLGAQLEEVSIKQVQYTTELNGREVFVHPSCIGIRHPPRYLFYHTCVYTKKEYMRQVSMIESEWVAEVSPPGYMEQMKGLLKGKKEQTHQQKKDDDEAEQIWQKLSQ
ncbi:putative Pre-mRNA-splicing factor ATP-dependent RNA helicase DEAH1 [Blattamonas nauphoetae]|uniref:RNA helicase n=1 Tax=Blattamonas nauphoetae TaxID=2049346 RepID=A0ABQ9XKN1_9EUKA|nr:putative Pre-mRNA-splicing factor ATP-dependent RNA helicase DEAH1 [Blattamonas nauphoetae]